MIHGPMIHPPLLRALAGAGHGAKILIADSNYPHETWANPRSTVVFLNLAPGLVNAMDVLEVLKKTIPLEAAAVMLPAEEDGHIDVPIHDEFRAALPDIEVTGIRRWDFYPEAGSNDVAVVIATGEARIYANLLLTIGVRHPDEHP
ncbi:RbsD/FucU family protein [Tessaracoccus antarcticus]|uniref:RbsD or FucU transport n=1 Tax=Tessaracoccus antarcticus TaxID=2479848 RepID=A0A3M0GA74_9ACTN|nr:RbsD/FucU family protein [Tessaracoccus antarcticus]RMB61860.1 RbsD or FucU transport [Tessaracoccus antarcticus]